MSSLELRRVEVLARVKSKQLKLKEAAELLGVCYRQAKRLWKRYRGGGAKALKHGNAGGRSNRAKPGSGGGEDAPDRAAATRAGTGSPVEKAVCRDEGAAFDDGSGDANASG